MLEMSTQHKATSSKVVRKQIKSSQDTSFFTLADTFIENMRKQGKYNRVVTEQPRVNGFREFLGGKDITFPEITVSLLNKFKAYLLTCE